MALLALGASFSPASAPDGPRLAFYAISPAPLQASVNTTDADGLDLRKVVGGRARIAPSPAVIAHLTWDPDGSRLVFDGFDHRGPGFAVVDADGSNLRFIPHTLGDNLFPVFSSDGQRIAFAGARTYYKPRGRERDDRKRAARKITVFAVFTISIDGTGLKRLTPWRQSNDVPSAFSPNGSILLVSRARGEMGDAVAIRTDGSGSYLVARNATFPAYSPDGSKIAFVRTVGRGRRKDGNSFDKTDLFVSSADGSSPVRLTQSPDQVKFWPNWDPSGRRIVFTQFSERYGSLFLRFFGIGSRAMEINADGSCLKQVLGAPRTGFFAATWQPGPGREAGAISC